MRRCPICGGDLDEIYAMECELKFSNFCEANETGIIETIDFLED